MNNNSIARFLDQLLETNKLKSDAALARACHVAPPVICKIRAGALKFGPTLMLRIHDAFGTDIKMMRAVAAEAAAA